MIDHRAGLTIYPFAPSELGLYAKSPDADGRVVPSTAAEAIAATGARAVLDGPMFELCGTVTGATQIEQYRTATCAKLQALHYDRARGLNVVGVPSTAGNGLVLLATETGTIEVDPSTNRTQVAQTLDLRVAVQLRPWMVRGGRALGQSTAGSNGSAEWRAALGQLADGQLALAIGAYAMQDFANRLVAAGFVEAGYTDGGGSTRIELASGEHYGAGENRRVASWITVGGGMGGGALLAGAAVAAAAYWLWRRR